MSMEEFDVYLYEVDVYDAGTQHNYKIMVEAQSQEHALEVAESKGRYLEAIRACRCDW